MERQPFIRTEYLIGAQAIEKLHHARIAVFGVGGVGSYTVEALARSGIGTLDLIDHDTFSVSNLNRQLYATTDTIGQLKVDAAKQRIHSICADITVNTYPCFYLPEKKDAFDFAQYDYIVDAIDTVTAKIALIEEAERTHTPIISAMGCGNRLDPSKLACMDLFETKSDPLAKVMRHELRKRGIDHLKVVCSSELPTKPIYPDDMPMEGNTKKAVPGSTAFVPCAAGLLIASVVVRDLIQK